MTVWTGPAGRSRAAFGLGLALLLLLSSYLLSDGTFAFRSSDLTTAIHSEMWSRLSHLDVSIDPAIMHGEGFAARGRITSYFLPLPALVRGLLSMAGLKEYPGVSVLLAVAVFGAVSGLLFLKVIRIQSPTSPVSRLGHLCLVLLIGASPILALLTCAQVYWEAITWADAAFLGALFSSVCVLSAESGVQLFVFSLVCGLSLFARPTVSIAVILLYVLTLLASQIQERRRPATANRLAMSTYLKAIAIFAVFLGLLGCLNTARWGSPIEFGDLRTNDIVAHTRKRLAVYEQFGVANIARVPMSAEYYLLPAWDNFSGTPPFIRASDRLESRRAMFDLVEHPLPVPVVWPFYSLLSILGIVLFVRALVQWLKGRACAPVLRCLLPSAAVSFMPAMALLVYPVQADRYIGDFLPPMILFAVVAASWMCACATEKAGSVVSKPILYASAAAMVSAALVSAYLSVAGALVVRRDWYVGDEVRGMRQIIESHDVLFEGLVKRGR